MKMRLFKLQDNDKKAKKLRLEKLPKDWEDIEQVFYYQDLPYVQKVSYLELISRYYDNLLTGHFDIEKTWKLIIRKYY